MVNRHYIESRFSWMRRRPSGWWGGGPPLVELVSHSSLNSCRGRGEALIKLMYICFILLFILEENVAFNKSAWQEYPATNLERFGAEQAVDGLYSELSLYGGQCTMSEYGHSTATWRVDLGKVHNIAHIVVYFPNKSKFFFKWIFWHCFLSKKKTKLF